MTAPTPSHRQAPDPYSAASAMPPVAAHPQGGPVSSAHASSYEPDDVGEVSLGDLVGNVTRDLSTLLRQEFALAQAELKQEATKTAKGGGAMAGAGLAAVFVLLFLSLALWAGLSHVMDAGWAALIVALIWAGITGVLFITGRSRLRQVRPTPERTVETLSQVPDALKGSRGGNT